MLGMEMLDCLYNTIAIKKYSSYKLKRLDHLFHCGRKSKVILFSTPKVASSTLKRLLNMIEAEASGEFHVQEETLKNESSVCGFLGLDDSFETIFRGDKYFRFCFVRNPYTRTLSCYLDKFFGKRRKHYLSKVGVHDRDEISFREFLLRLKNRRNLHRNPHWAPQSYLIRPDTIRYDFIGRFEHLHDHLHVLTSRLDCEHFMERMDDIAVMHHRTGAGERVRKFIGEEEARLIREIYDRDFVYFAYPRDLELCHV